MVLVEGRIRHIASFLPHAAVNAERDNIHQGGDGRVNTQTAAHANTTACAAKNFQEMPAATESSRVALMVIAASFLARYEIARCRLQWVMADPKWGCRSI